MVVVVVVVEGLRLRCELIWSRLESGSLPYSEEACLGPPTCGNGRPGSGDSYTERWSVIYCFLFQY